MYCSFQQVGIGMTGMTLRNFQLHSLNLLELQEYRVTNHLTAMHMDTETLHCLVFVLTSTGKSVQNTRKYVEQCIVTCHL